MSEETKSHSTTGSKAIYRTPLNAFPQHVEEFEKEYELIAYNFKRIQKEQYELFAAKMLSYGLHNISVGTNLENEVEVKLSLTGVWFRMNDKIQRLKQMILLNRTNALDNEPVEDAYKDLSVYGIICQLVKGGFWKK